ncbi:YheC/YheD family protein [Xylanibacillus composti]|uniref:YheC/YheD family protein n=1 Tax=Xylanibacillus composti TaxID=1572762 RepID=A0A8J4H728_9BACL|nr:YheC/YheD family protein [Xylanibacillus composti]MDT9724662.1 YheC/YheD family protein [Xylanibacillus composti]GIQ70947.1 hypothetical protein XYCOK13_37710 [Xylanibacillus composti]
MSNRMVAYPASKWNKYLIMAKDSELRPYLPHTAKLTKATLKSFLERFPTVYAKPNFGGGGRGVMRITCRPNGTYLLQSGKGKKLCFHFPHLTRTMARQIGSGKHYLIQQGIDMIQLDNRPIDFRILLLKQDGSWTYMGTMGKLAARNLHITNRCSGGTPIQFKDACKRAGAWEEKQIDKLEKNLTSLGLQSAKVLNKSYPLLTELGLDIAIDRKQNIWVLEANSKPQYELFRHHESSQLYKKIHRTVQLLRVSQ